MNVKQAIEGRFTTIVSENGNTYYIFMGVMVSKQHYEFMLDSYNEKDGAE